MGQDPTSRVYHLNPEYLTTPKLVIVVLTCPPGRHDLNRQKKPLHSVTSSPDSTTTHLDSNHQNPADLNHPSWHNKTNSDKIYQSKTTAMVSTTLYPRNHRTSRSTNVAITRAKTVVHRALYHHYRNYVVNPPQNRSKWPHPTPTLQPQFCCWTTNHPGISKMTAPPESSLLYYGEERRGESLAKFCLLPSVGETKL